MIVPGFELGAKKADPNTVIDVRVLGNWYDASKAAELAISMFDAGVDVILTVSGGANQGAKARRKYVLCLDEDLYELAPGTIAGCAALSQERAVYERVIDAVEGNLPYGEAVLEPIVY